MIKKTNWTEREFEFNFPTGIFPCIIERLRGTPARLEDIINKLPIDLLTMRVNNSWSIQENVGHLFDLETLGESRLADFLSHSEVLTPADMQNRKTNEANHNSNSMQNLLRQFRRSRQGLVDKLERLDEGEVARFSLHPRLDKPMRIVDWTYFMAEHDDHHIARISELAKILQNRSELHITKR
ncbi:MAG: DinB family protein [Bacteroidota bacterium]